MWGGGGGGGTEGFWRGEGPSSELIYPIRLHMLSCRRGGDVESLITFRSSPHHTFKWNGPYLNHSIHEMNTHFAIPFNNGYIVESFFLFSDEEMGALTSLFDILKIM